MFWAHNVESCNTETLTTNRGRGEDEKEQFSRYRSYTSNFDINSN